MVADKNADKPGRTTPDYVKYIVEQQSDLLAEIERMMR